MGLVLGSPADGVGRRAKYAGACVAAPVADRPSRQWCVASLVFPADVTFSVFVRASDRRGARRTHPWTAVQPHNE